MVKNGRKMIVFAVLFAGLLGFAVLGAAYAQASARGRFFTGF